MRSKLPRANVSVIALFDRYMSRMATDFITLRSTFCGMIVIINLVLFNHTEILFTPECFMKIIIIKLISSSSCEDGENVQI